MPRRKSPKFTTYDGPSIPQDLSSMDDTQIEGVLSYYISLPLSELRVRQDFNRQYHDMVSEQVEREGWGERLRRANINLGIDDDLLMYGVMFQKWPENRARLTLLRVEGDYKRLYPVGEADTVEVY